MQLPAQLQKFMKKKFIIPAIIIVAASFGIYAKVGMKPATEYVTANVVKGRLTQTVSETGTVKAAKELNLNFLNTGKVAKTPVQVGEKVKKDQVLAELDFSQLAIKEKQASANLSKLLNGASAQDIAVTQATVSQAETAYYSALTDLGKVQKSTAENIAQVQKNLGDLENHTPADVTNFEQAVSTAEVNLENTKRTYEQALNNRMDSSISTADEKLVQADIALDNINKVLSDENAKNTLSAKDPTYLTATNNDHSAANSLIAVADQNLAESRTAKTVDGITATMDSVLSVLAKTSGALGNCYKVLENTTVSSAFSQAELDAFKASISAQQTVISGAISSAQSSKQALRDADLAYDTNVAGATSNLLQARVSLDNALTSARNAYNTAVLNADQQNSAARARVDSALKAWDLAKTQLAKIKAPARKEDIALAQADLDSVRSQISNSVIKSPIDGIITKMNYEIGEDVSPSKPVISLLGENNLEIEILVSEADIAKAAVGQLSEITFDAFPSDIIFKGRIYFIEPAETVVQDVVYYKVKVELTDIKDVEQKFGESVRVKSGMTANVSVMTAEKNDVLIVPARAIVEKSDGSKIVRILSGNTVNEASVQIGLRGDEGRVEVVSQTLKEGDVVVTSVK